MKVKFWKKDFLVNYKDLLLIMQQLQFDNQQLHNQLHNLTLVISTLQKELYSIRGDYHENRYPGKMFDKIEVNFKTFALPKNEVECIFFYTRMPVPNDVYKAIWREIDIHFKFNNIKTPFMIIGNELELANVKGSDSLPEEDEHRD